MKSSQNDWLLSELRGHTFDDFLIFPGIGQVEHRRDINLQTKFSEHIGLNVPLVSSNMDTVTESMMAIALAKAGGIGVIHRYLTIEREADEVQKAKRGMNLVISDPYSIGPDANIGEARKLMKWYNVGCLVVMQGDKFLGILTTLDVRFVSDEVLVTDRMQSYGNLDCILPCDSGKKPDNPGPWLTVERIRERLDRSRLKYLPVLDHNNIPCGLITGRDIENFERYPLANRDKNGQLVVGAAVGATGDFLERTAALIEAGADVIVVDIANGQSNLMKQAVLAIRGRFIDVELVIGNFVVSSQMREYEAMGVNGFKIGLGPGGACTTRYQTSIGDTQAHAVAICNIATTLPICADGGVRRNGHIAFATIALGASSVMMGGMFSGTDETPGCVYEDEDGKYKIYRGMASREAMLDRLEAELHDDPYEASQRLTPEGKPKRVDYRGPVEPILNEMVDSLCSAVSYIGGHSLTEAQAIFAKDPRHFLVGPLSEAARRESFER